MSRADWRDLLEDGGGGRGRGSRRGRGGGSRLPGARGWLLGAAVALAAVIAGGAGGWAVEEGELLPLGRVAVTEPVERVDGEAVRERLAPHLHPSLVGVDTRGAERALERLPWVRSATVTRAWPETIEVALEERVPLARWRDTALLDVHGEPFRPPEGTVPQGLPRLAGPEGSAEEVASLFRSMRQLFDKQDVTLVALSLSPRGSWRAETADGVEIAVGRERPEARVARFTEALPALKAHGDGPMERVDLRYPNGFAVAWGEAAQGH